MTSLRLLLWVVMLLPAAVVTAPMIKLEPWGDDSIRVRIGPKSIAEQAYPALLPTAPKHTTPTHADENSLTNGNLRIEYDPTSAFITATRISDGVQLLKQTELAFASPVGPVSRPDSLSVLVSFAGHGSSERIYGLGEHRTGRVQQLPYRKLLQDSKCYTISKGSDVPIPFYSSSLGYGFVWNSPSLGLVDLSENALTWFNNASANADFWITTTSADLNDSTSPYANIMHHMVDAVGHASPMPYYASGFIQCKNRYREQSQLLDIANGYITRGLPLSTIVVDFFHWVHQGDWTFNPTCWPDVPMMVNELHSMGVETMVTFWPLLEVPSTHFPPFNHSHYFATDLHNQSIVFDDVWFPTYLVDTFNENARRAQFEAFWEGYGRYGIKTIWTDASEPESFDCTIYDRTMFATGSGTELASAWVRQHAMSFADGLHEKGISADEYFILMRHAWSGTWRFSAALWSGDIDSTFDEFKLQIAAAQGVAMSGVVLWTTDVGGFNGGNPEDPVFQELVVRWWQFGAFCPLFRTHGTRSGGPPANECGDTNGDNEVWNLAKDQEHYNAMASVMHLRESLRPYIMNINRQAVLTGMPMLRPMILQFPHDAACALPDVENQYMFGPDWLVSPVSTYQAREWSVYLPKLAPDELWVYWWNQTHYMGGQRVTIATPIAEFPLFERRAVVPEGRSSMVSLWSEDRQEQLLCLSSRCFADNQPSEAGHYQPVRTESFGFLNTDHPVVVDGQIYDTVALQLFFSFDHADCFVSTNTSAPDNTYVVTFNDGFVLREQAPGSIPLQVWFKQYNATHWDYASVASAAGIQWARSLNYRFVANSGFVFSNQVQKK